MLGIMMGAGTGVQKRLLSFKEFIVWLVGG